MLSDLGKSLDDPLRAAANCRGRFSLAEQFAGCVRYCCFGRVRMVPELSHKVEEEDKR